MSKLVLFVILSAIGFGLVMLQAQLVVWGLSLFHVNSGIWGPLLLITALESVVAGGVSTGIGSQK